MKISRTQKNIKIIFLVVLLTKLFVLIINLVKILLFTEEMILEKYDYCNGVMKQYFNKNLFMTVNEEQIFQLTNSCWICNNLFDAGDEKVRDHCHITGKFRGAAHFSCNANFKLSKEVPVIFHN